MINNHNYVMLCLCRYLCVQFQYTISQLQYLAPVYLRKGERRIDASPGLRRKACVCACVCSHLHLHVCMRYTDVNFLMVISCSCFIQSRFMTAQRARQIARSVGQYQRSTAVCGVQEIPPQVVFTTNPVPVHLQVPAHLLRSHR